MNRDRYTTKVLLNKTSLLLIFNIFFSSTMLSQKVYFKSIETSYLNYQFETVQYDVGPGWQGYNLPNEENGVELNFALGRKIKEKLEVSLALGYLNFEGIDAFEIFSQLSYSFLKRKISPIISWRLGYLHLWNQYENGKSSAFSDFGAGAKWKINQKLSISLQSGFLFTNQVLFVPIRLGLDF